MIDLGHQNKEKVCGELCEALEKDSHVVVPFPLSQKNFDNAAKHFFSFLALPQEYKEQFYFKHEGNERDSGVGYVRKDKKRGEYDNKEYFHYHPVVEEYFELLLSDCDRVVTDFFHSARMIYNEGEKHVQQIIQGLDNKYPGLYKKIFPLQARWGSVLRFLKYDAQGMGEFLAAGHYDYGSCTLALAESAPGLRIGKDNKTLKEVERIDNTVLFFPSLQFPQLTHNDIRPTWHDVVQKSEEKFNKDTARWAIVFFVGGIDVETPTLEATHTPLEY